MADDKTALEQLNSADALIVQGRIREAGELVEKIKSAKLSRKQKLKLASLLRRIGFPDRGIKLLLPIVRAKKVLSEPVTAGEKAEYAICLQRQGSITEATKILTDVDHAEAPEAGLYEGMIALSDWDFESAVNHLQKVIALGPDTYIKRTARLNLCAAHVMGANFQAAEPLLKELIEELKKREENLLLSNALEVQSQQYILSEDFDRASECLDQAENLLHGIKVLDRLWIMKWRAILNAKKSKRPELLEPAMEEAIRKDHRETMRDLDYQRLLLKFDRGLFLKLYFGTRSKHYRARLLRRFPQSPIPDSITLLGEQGISEATNEAADILSAFKNELGPGSLPHAMLILLLSDWYIKFRSGHVHSSLFPDDFFNPETSMNRIHQIAKRLRDNLGEQIPGLELDPQAGAYRLSLESAKISLMIEAQLPEGHPDDIRIHLLKRKFPQGFFTSSDVEKTFEVSRTAANRLLLQWREAGRVQVEGSMTSPRYKF